MKADISANSTLSKLVLLVLHFPKLRLIWCSSPHASVEIISDLKAQQPEPDANEAVDVGVEQLFAPSMTCEAAADDLTPLHSYTLTLPLLSPSLSLSLFP